MTRQGSEVDWDAERSAFVAEDATERLKGNDGYPSNGNAPAGGPRIGMLAEASAVGRLSVRVFGMEEKAGIASPIISAARCSSPISCAIIDEDAAIGRLYLPREALQAADILTSDPAAVLAHPRLAQACEPVVARAREHFAEADRIMANCARRSVRAPRIMAAAYRAILRRPGRARLGRRRAGA